VDSGENLSPQNFMPIQPPRMPVCAGCWAYASRCSVSTTVPRSPRIRMPPSGTSSSAQGNRRWDRDTARQALQAPVGHDAGPSSRGSPPTSRPRQHAGPSPGCGWYAAVGGPDNQPSGAVPYLMARQEKDSPLIALLHPLGRPQRAATWGSHRNGTTSSELPRPRKRRECSPGNALP
jgi:hypothetical protein